METSRPERHPNTDQAGYSIPWCITGQADPLRVNHQSNRQVSAHALNQEEHQKTLSPLIILSFGLSSLFILENETSGA